MHQGLTELSPVSDFLESALEEIDRKGALQSPVTGVTTGFSNIDWWTGGFQRGDLVAIAARPSMGKTSFVLSTALAAAKDAGAPVAFFSLDRTRHDVIEWLLCAEAGLKLTDLRKPGHVAGETLERLRQSAAALESLPLFIDETSALTVADINRRCERLAAQSGLSMVVVDYLQLLASAPTSQEMNRNDELTDICRALKATAKRLNVPVIVLSQLRRAVDRRRNKRPLLIDVRYFGLEQHADFIAFLYRDSYYSPTAPEPELAEFIIVKNRSGGSGTPRLRFQSDFARFAPHEAS